MQQTIESEELEVILPLDRISILVIENDPETLALLELLLTHLGATVFTAITMKTALKGVECYSPIF